MDPRIVGENSGCNVGLGRRTLGTYRWWIHLGSGTLAMNKCIAGKQSNDRVERLLQTRYPTIRHRYFVLGFEGSK
jgi:hypothetical protein